MNGKVLMLAIIFFGGFHVFYVFNRVQNFANIMNRLCTIQLGECPRKHTSERLGCSEVFPGPQTFPSCWHHCGVGDYHYDDYGP